MKSNTWQLQDAKSKFSKLVEDALHGEPQFVTRYGKNSVVVISSDDYRKMTQPDTDLVTFLRDSPLAGEGLDVSRAKDVPREVEL